MNACDSGETWLPVPGFEGLYEVSSVGHVRSTDRVVIGGPFGLPQTRKGRLRKPQMDHGGYYRVILYRDGKPGVSHGIHKLVALAFHPEGWFEGADVRHLDGVRTNNVASNLAWGTRSENMQDAVRHGTLRRTHCRRGHELTPENSAEKDRECLTCRRKRHNESQREARRLEALWSKESPWSGWPSGWWAS